MTVAGIGVDVVDVDGFVEQLEAPGSRFSVGAFTAGERTDLRRAADDRAHELGEPRSVAARFAAKEAFVKAWSSSRFGARPALAEWDLHDIEVISDAWGRPSLRVGGAVAEAVRDQWGDDWRAHLSLTHDGSVAAAFVVLEVAPFDGWVS